ncbi:MAG: hypothetical protein ACU84Q_02190 [Gammaproteobacteria bacterium]
MDNAHFASIVAKANGGEMLGDNEQLQVSALIGALFIALSISRATGTRTGALDDRADEQEYVSRTYTDNPDLAPYWNPTDDYIHIIRLDFAEQINVLRTESNFPLRSVSGAKST